MKIYEIWGNEDEREKSILNKVSFQFLLNKLETIEKKLLEENNEGTEILLNMNESSIVSLSQSFYSISRDELNIIINTILCNKKDGEDKKKRDFLSNLLIKFDFILPQQKFEYSQGNFIFLFYCIFLISFFCFF